MVSIRDLASINRELTGDQVADHIPVTGASSAVEGPILCREDAQPQAVQASASGLHVSQSLTLESDEC